MDDKEINDAALAQLRGELESKEKIPFEIWLQEFVSSHNPFRRLSLLFKLPLCCEQSGIDEDKARQISLHFPTNLLSQFILQQRDEDVVDLVVTIINIVIPLCSVKERERFRPLSEGILESICLSRGMEEKDLEIRLNALCLIGITYLSVDDINGILNVIIGFIKDNVDQFPSQVIMDFAIDALKTLNKLFNTDNQMNSVALSWPADLRTVIERLLRTFNIPVVYLTFSFISAGITSQIVGTMWLTSNKMFFQLLASLTSGQIRIETEDPKKINGDALVSCFQLEETFVNCIETDESDIDDTVATVVGKTVQEAASFCCEYLGACTKEQVTLDIGIKLAFYRFICMFATIGGLQIIDKDNLTSSINSLLEVFEYAISQRDHETAALLLPNLPDFPVLPRNTLDLLLKYVQLMFPIDKGVCLSQISQVLHELKDRKEFYTTESMNSAVNFANQTKSRELLEAIKNYTS